MSPVRLRDLGFQRNQPEDREDLSRTTRPERGHPEHSSRWQNNEGDNIHPAIHTLIQWRPQTRGLERHGSSSSAPPTPQGPIPMEHGKQEVQPGISLGRTWSKFPEDLSQRDGLQRPYGNHQRLESCQEGQTPGGKGTEHKGESSHYPSYRRTVKPDRAYSDSFRLTRIRPNQLSSGFTPFRNQEISGQESPFFTIPGSFQEKTRKQWQEQNVLQTEEERVSVTTMAIHLLGSPYGISSHSPFMANWPYPSPVANMATSLSYEPFLAICLLGPSLPFTSIQKP
ncbi:hypothetical protein O181_047766 [Austropuccinia psidii MF-1]|uniref:Uncharacterized protein n=1 Tax=Austropuccinia psidii MF-1 TaxID=1389203 RepID=A0A9Q3DPE0_9BASI|nr:hypothetical protein [Austropuccinia psidii MF-1]